MRRSLVASVVSLFAMTFVYSAITATVGIGLFERFTGAALSGMMVYLVVLLVGQRRQLSRSKETHGASTHNHR